MWRRRHSLERQSRTAHEGGSQETGVLLSCCTAWPHTHRPTSASAPTPWCIAIGQLFPVWAATKPLWGSGTLKSRRSAKITYSSILRWLNHCNETNNLCLFKISLPARHPGFVWKHPSTQKFSCKVLELHGCLLLHSLVDNWAAQHGLGFYFFSRKVLM